MYFKIRWKAFVVMPSNLTSRNFRVCWNDGSKERKFLWFQNPLPWKRRVVHKRYETNDSLFRAEWEPGWRVEWLPVVASWVLGLPLKNHWTKFPNLKQRILQIVDSMNLCIPFSSYMVGESLKLKANHSPFLRSNEVFTSRWIAFVRLCECYYHTSLGRGYWCERFLHLLIQTS